MLHHTNPELLAVSVSDALKFWRESQKPTIILWISDDGNYSMCQMIRGEISKNPSILAYRTVSFDDIEEKTPNEYKIGKTLIDKQHVQEICGFVEPFISQVETILIHCTRWRQRSPSVAMALSQLYGIPYMDESEFREKYRDRNITVYNTMIEVGERIRSISH